MTLHDAIRLHPVRTRREWKRFHRLPAAIQAGRGQWIQPLALHARQMWAPRHPWFRHAQAMAWVAVRDGVPVGRISAQVDRLQAEAGRPTLGLFGQLEGVDDPAVFQALLDGAGEWLREQGMTQMQGPFDLSINQQCGVLVDGFEHSPMMMMNYNPPWYPRHLEQAGLQKQADLLAYRGPADFVLPPRVERMIARLQRRFEIRALARAELGAMAETLRAVFNASWADNWGFVPLTQEEFVHLVGEMKILVRPGYVQVARIDGRAVGFIVTLPDLNELIADLHGKLWPTGAVKLLWRLARRRNRAVRIPLMGILPEYQQTAMGAAIVYALIRTAQGPALADGIELSEQSWILEDNRGMCSIVESIGMQPAQRFRIYGRSLSA